MMNHNDFPKMTEEFDRSVRRALDSLPERASKPVRRFSAKKIVCVGLAAALCIGGTAFAANAQSWFCLLYTSQKPSAGQVRHRPAAHPGMGELRKSKDYHIYEHAKAAAADKKLTFALAGNQNCGKTTLFNLSLIHI